MGEAVKVVFLGTSSRGGKRRDGTSAVFHNVDLMVPGVGAGQIGVDEAIAGGLVGVAFGTECEVEFSARVWNGKLEFRASSIKPLKRAA